MGEGEVVLKEGSIGMWRGSVGGKGVVGVANVSMDVDVDDDGGKSRCLLNTSQGM